MQHLCRMAEELTPGQPEMLQTLMHQPQRCILGFARAPCWEKLGVLQASLVSHTGAWCRVTVRSPMVAGPGGDGVGVTSSRTHCHRDLLPPCPVATTPAATAPFTQPERRISLALEQVQEQEETTNPPTAGCKSHKKSERLERSPGDVGSFLCLQVPFPPQNAQLGTCQPIAAFPLTGNDLRQCWPWCDQ